MSRTRNKQRYDEVHNRAKHINFILISVFFTLSSYCLSFGPWILGNVFGVLTIYLFIYGINNIAYIDEEIHGYRHRHKKF